MSRNNEIRNIKWHETCKCKCRLHASHCNNKQRLNKDKCRCKCKELILREKCPYLQLFWFIFSRICIEYEGIWAISPYLVGIRENADQINSK